MIEEILPLYEEGFSDIEISKRISVSSSAVAYWRRKIGLSSNTMFSRRKLLISRGYSLQEIAKDENSTLDNIYIWAKKYYPNMDLD